MSRPSTRCFLKANKKKSVKEKMHYTSAKEESTIDIFMDELCTPVTADRSSCNFSMDNRGACSGDQESEPDRSNPAWMISPVASVGDEEPEEVVEEKKAEPSVWDEIMEEYERERMALKNLELEDKPFEPELPKGSKLTAVQYLQEYIFPLLCPALEDTLSSAKKEDCLQVGPELRHIKKLWNSLQIQKCVFNGLDHLAELLWNRNPMHPKRISKAHKYIFDIPFVKIWLQENPRPIYPLSWIWTKEEAITVMQSYIRRFLVCCDPGCCEMRKFWQTFKREKKEEEHRRMVEHFGEVQEIVSDMLNEIVAAAVYISEKKIHGCFCLSKPCHCECKCFKWCKCCKCYKQEKSVAPEFYSDIAIKKSESPKLLSLRDE